ncbi:hypothetical protein ACFYTS_26020 [Nocardia sp. NPDC004151]|uniref:hypothetical protein n=1 Tax=Nocardia sp. NPDC004151 TaxID=3364304 RepID=UPI0036C988CC
MTSVIESAGAVLVDSPCLLRAQTLEIDGGEYIAEYRSPRVKPNQPVYAPLAEYLAENPHTVVYEDEVRDVMMMGYKAIIRLYRLDD